MHSSEEEGVSREERPRRSSEKEVTRNWWDSWLAWEPNDWEVYEYVYP